MKKILTKNLITEKIGALTVERIVTASEYKNRLKNWHSLSHEEQKQQLNTYYSNLQKGDIYKESINRRGLLYFLLAEDFKILYIGSSKNTDNSRLLQCNRIVSKEKPSVITANDVGWEYDNRIKYAVKIKTMNYHNFEVHLIHSIKPELNTNCISNYCSKWEYSNTTVSLASYKNFNFYNFHENGIFNEACKIPYELIPIQEFMRRNPNFNTKHEETTNE